MANYKKRGSSWQYEISYKKTDGSFSKLRKAGFKTKKAAIAAAEKIESDLRRGFKADTKDMLLSDFFWEWFELYKQGTIARATENKYRDTHTNLTKIAKYDTVKNLTRARYQELINIYAKTHTKETVTNFNTHLRAALQDAIMEGYIVTDPTYKVVLKGNVESKKNSEKFISYKDLKLIISYLTKNIEDNNTSYLAILIGAVTGMRVGEVLGLTWDNINYKTNKVSVEKAWDYKYNTGFVPLKTEAAYRVLLLNDDTIRLLKEYKQYQKNILNFHNQENELNNIFYSPFYGVPTSANLNKHLRKICNNLKINQVITMHGLRHTFASVLLFKGVSIFKVSNLLGHSNVSVTQDVYSHVIKELDNQENKKINEVQNSLFVI